MNRNVKNSNHEEQQSWRTAIMKNSNHEEQQSWRTAIIVLSICAETQRSVKNIRYERSVKQYSCKHSSISLIITHSLKWEKRTKRETEKEESEEQDSNERHFYIAGKQCHLFGDFQFFPARPSGKSIIKMKTYKEDRRMVTVEAWTKCREMLHSH
jgi:hypothetical protein